MLFVDAVAAHYLEHGRMPWLSTRWEKQGRPMRPLPAFLGIGATLLTGRWPEEHGVWTNFVRDPHPPKFHERLFRLYDLVRPSDRYRWIVRYLTYRAFRRHVPIPHQIPSKWIHQFRNAGGAEISNRPRIGGFPTLRARVEEAGRSFYSLSARAPGDDEHTTAEMVRAIEDGRADVIYGKLDRLDALGHRWGPKSERIGAELRSVDEQARRVAQAAEENDVDLVIFSDHGMAQVRETVDVLADLETAGYLPTRDFIPFVDSTMLRLWFSDDAARRAVQGALEDHEAGTVLTEENLRREHLPVDPERFGEVIFALNEGLAFPWDFFHTHGELNGVHGYFDSAPLDVPILMHLPASNRTAVLPPAPDFTDILPLVMGLLDGSS